MEAVEFKYSNAMARKYKLSLDKVVEKQAKSAVVVEWARVKTVLDAVRRNMEPKKIVCQSLRTV